MTDAMQDVLSDRDSAERHIARGTWLRRLAILALVAIVALALANVAGQRASTVHAAAPKVVLTVHSPTAVRAGLLFQAKITVTANTAVPNAHLVLGHGWFDGLTMNTEEPSASTEMSAPDGSVVLYLGSLKAGQSFVQYLEYQVNATSVGQRPQYVAVTSGGQNLVSLTRTMTIFP
jgi:hypothetical protein